MIRDLVRAIDVFISIEVFHDELNNLSPLLCTT